VTIDTIAAAAGVGRQTIYRWWPSKGAMLLEALAERAAAEVPAPATGTLAGDLAAFVRATFRAAGPDGTRAALRATMAEAQRDPAARALMEEFVARRRRALRDVLTAARDEIAPDADLDLAVDQVFGVLWYRCLVGGAPLDDAAADRLAAGLVRQLGGAADG
jgi:AcrR family transcriptional regulator